MRFAIGGKSLVAVLGFGLTGVSFTVGNLLLARELPPSEFGQVALAVAVFTVCVWLAPLGFDQVLLRRSIDPGPRLLLRLTLSSAAVSALSIAFMIHFYDMPPGLAMLLGAASTGGGVALASGLGLRRHGWPVLSLLMTNIASWALLISGLIGLALPHLNAYMPLTVLAVAAAGSAVVAWLALALRHRVPLTDRDVVPRGEAAALLVVAASGALVVQIERFVIPQMLGLDDLAVYAVIASVAIFPFRLLRSGSGFAMVPQLRALSDRAARRRLLVTEGRTIAAMLVGATVIVVLAAPMVAETLTNGRYRLGPWLVLAGCLNGGAKLVEGLPRSAVIACGTVSEVRLLGLWSWFGILTSVLGAWLGAFWGLSGLICGCAFGSLVGSLPSVALARRVVTRGYVG